jgi:hypothetical protein
MYARYLDGFKPAIKWLKCWILEIKLNYRALIKKAAVKPLLIDGFFSETISLLVQHLIQHSLHR